MCALLKDFVNPVTGHCDVYHKITAFRVDMLSREIFVDVGCYKDADARIHHAPDYYKHLTFSLLDFDSDDINAILHSIYIVLSRPRLDNDGIDQNLFTDAVEI